MDILKILPEGIQDITPPVFIFHLSAMRPCRLIEYPSLSPLTHNSLYHSLALSITLNHHILLSITLSPSITLYHPLLLNTLSVTLHHSLSPSITQYHSLSPSITLYHRLLLYITLYPSLPISSISYSLQGPPESLVLKSWGSNQQHAILAY